MSELSDLDLDILGLAPVAPRIGAGRQAKPLSAEFERPLTEADLAMPAKQVQKPPAIVKIRDTHHALARVLATGVSEHEASLVTGYSASRISILKADPTFAELLEFYREKGSDAVADFRDRMAGVGLDALNLLQEQMDESPEKFTPGILKEIARDMADRTGHAPQRGPTSVTQINVQLSDRMKAARERVASARPTIPILPSDIDHE